MRTVHVATPRDLDKMFPPSQALNLDVEAISGICGYDYLVNVILERPESDVE